MLTIEEYLRVSNQMRDYYAKKIKNEFTEYNFSPNEISILIVLKNNPSITTSTQLKVVLSVSKALVSRSVDALEKKGLVQVETDSNDKRISHIVLTKKSSPIIGLIDEKIQLFNENLFKDIDEKEMKIFKDVLDKLRIQVERELTDENV